MVKQSAQCYNKHINCARQKIANKKNNESVDSIMKRSKAMGWIVISVITVLVVSVVVWGKQYYDNRYVGKDYYTMVPLDYNITPETIYSDNGNDMGLGVKYKITAYNEQGEAKAVEFTVFDDPGAELPQPGTYLRISASEQIVLNWKVIEKRDVPDGALAKIK